MSERYVALLRGVNVGGRNKVPMADLRALFESLGLSGATTYVQSGNVVFDAGRRPPAADLEVAVANRFEVAVRIVVVPAVLLLEAVAEHPFTGAPPAHRHVGFMVDPPAAGAADLLDRTVFLPEEFSVRGETVHLLLPSGMARTKLPAHLERRLATPITFRNWNTVSALSDLVAG